MAKQFKLIRTIRTIIESPLTERLSILKYRMETLQIQYPDDEFKIVDGNGESPQIIDFITADLANPINKAKRLKASQKAEHDENLKLKVKRL